MRWSVDAEKFVNAAAYVLCTFGLLICLEWFIYPFGTWFIYGSVMTLGVVRFICGTVAALAVWWIVHRTGCSQIKSCAWGGVAVLVATVLQNIVASAIPWTNVAWTGVIVVALSNLAATPTTLLMRVIYRVISERASGLRVMRLGLLCGIFAIIVMLSISLCSDPVEFESRVFVVGKELSAAGLAMPVQVFAMRSKNLSGLQSHAYIVTMEVDRKGAKNLLSSAVENPKLSVTPCAKLDSGIVNSAPEMLRTVPSDGYTRIEGWIPRPGAAGGSITLWMRFTGDRAWIVILIT